MSLSLIDAAKSKYAQIVNAVDSYQDLTVRQNEGLYIYTLCACARCVA